MPALNDSLYTAAAEGQPSPRSLQPFPLILSAESWAHIETGVLQRVRLLNQLMADVYGPQQLLAEALLPPALVQGHPGYLRAMHAVRPPDNCWLHGVAFDLTRGLDGQWWLVSQHTQAPSGLGELLEHRRALSQPFSQAFDQLQVQPLLDAYHALLQALQRLCPSDQAAQPHIALLTPGPADANYSDHAKLARALGIPLVEGSDLTVRGERLYLRSLQGLWPLHGLLNRVDDALLDPLELQPDSTQGVPGLLQTIRAGKLLLANLPGSGFLESPALQGFMPGLAQRLSGQHLQLPALLPPMPSWNPEQQDDPSSPSPLLLRVFALCDGPNSWRVLPGGLTRVNPSPSQPHSMPTQEHSADLWVCPDSASKPRTGQPAPTSSPPQAPVRAPISSRAAENMFWLGRYTERADNAVRLAGLALHWLDDPGPVPSAPAALLEWLHRLAWRSALLAPAVTHLPNTKRAFESALLATLGQLEPAGGIGWNLRRIRQSAAAACERLAPDHWHLIVQAESVFLPPAPLPATAFTEAGSDSNQAAQRRLEATRAALAAITGVQSDAMTRDEGWQLLRIGRQIERLGFLSNALAAGFNSGSVATDSGVAAMLTLFDRSRSLDASDPQRGAIETLVALLVQDRNHPQALACVIQSLREHIATLTASTCDPLRALSDGLPTPDRWGLEGLCEPGPDGNYPALLHLLTACETAAYQVSDAIGSRAFMLSNETLHAVGA